MTCGKSPPVTRVPHVRSARRLQRRPPQWSSGAASFPQRRRDQGCASRLNRISDSFLRGSRPATRARQPTTLNECSAASTSHLRQGFGGSCSQLRQRRPLREKGHRRPRERRNNAPGCPRTRANESGKGEVATRPSAFFHFAADRAAAREDTPRRNAIARGAVSRRGRDCGAREWGTRVSCRERAGSDSTPGKRTRRPLWERCRRRNAVGAAVSARSALVEDRATEMWESIARLSGRGIAAIAEWRAQRPGPLPLMRSALRPNGLVAPVRCSDHSANQGTHAACRTRAASLCEKGNAHSSQNTRRELWPLRPRSARGVCEAALCAQRAGGAAMGKRSRGGSNGSPGPGARSIDRDYSHAESLCRAPGAGAPRWGGGVVQLIAQRTVLLGSRCTPW